MERAVQLFTQYQWWVYGFLGLVLLFYLRRALAARRQSLRSLFALEQEQARTKYRRSVIWAVIVLALAAVLFGASQYLLPATAEPTVEPTATATTGPLPEPTLTSTAPPPTITTTPTATQVRPTRLVPPTETPDVQVTEVPDIRPAACPNPGVRITSPGINQIVRGDFPLRGTASIDGFQYYKVEVGPGTNPQDYQWTVVGDIVRSAVGGGVLTTFNSGAYPPGPYTLRLVVVDQTGNYPEPCVVRITVER